ncbi:F-box/LRR-repeat protein At2g43260-like [Brassica napus]|uniref:F-box domain-containing protein n=2 Tax=Brassica TaxID=3705 RepID=A0A3P6AGA8_BRAOL|nr:F-box/LRR-repeat protein At2g43260-like [Brassica napus]CAF1697546.1 unnamed protein product [Brassica napus]VDC86453.1 unnamed protein product [Brassica oleracea]
MYLVPEVLEEIFLRLPLKSILKFKTVSKQWRSILESKRFAEGRRLVNIQTKLKIIVAVDRNLIQHELHRDEELEMVYLHSNVAASRPSLSCDSLVCIPVPGWVKVFNPSTGVFLRFSSGPETMISRHDFDFLDPRFEIFPRRWRMGFGKDNITERYKIVRICFHDDLEIHRCEILDVNIGRWRRLSPPPYVLGFRRKSTCVNGSIYWVEVIPRYKLLALNLHTEEWRDLTLPLGTLGTSCQVANLENRLALAATYFSNHHWNVKIWCMHAPQEEAWSVMYTIRLFPCEHRYNGCFPLWFWTRPVAVSKQGNLFFHDNCNRLFKYYPETDVLCCVHRDIYVISPFVEDLVPLGPLDSVPNMMRTYGLQHLDHVPFSSRISNFFRRMEFPSSLITTAFVTLATFQLCSLLSRS